MVLFGGVFFWWFLRGNCSGDEKVKLKRPGTSPQLIVPKSTECYRDVNLILCLSWTSCDLVSIPACVVFQPVDRVVDFVKDMQAKDLNKDDLSAVAQLAYLESQPGTAFGLLSSFSLTQYCQFSPTIWPGFAVVGGGAYWCAFKNQNSGCTSSCNSAKPAFLLSLHNGCQLVEGHHHDRD